MALTSGIYKISDKISSYLYSWSVHILNQLAVGKGIGKSPQNAHNLALQEKAARQTALYSYRYEQSVIAVSRDIALSYSEYENDYVDIVDYTREMLG